MPESLRDTTEEPTVTSFGDKEDTPRESTGEEPNRSSRDSEEEARCATLLERVPILFIDANNEEEVEEEEEEDSECQTSTSEVLRSSEDTPDKDNIAPNTGEDSNISPDAHGEVDSLELESSKDIAEDP